MQSSQTAAPWPARMAVLAIVACLFMAQASAAAHCPGTSTINSANIATFSHCTSMEDLVLEGDFTNFSTLDGLQQVDNLLVQHNSAITALSDFPGLQAITGELKIEDCSALASISGFANLQHMRVLRVVDCPVLQTVSAFGTLADLDDLTIAEAADLHTLTGFQSLLTWKHFALTDLPALHSLVNIAPDAENTGGVTLRRTGLQTITNSFTSLEIVSGDVYLDGELGPLTDTGDAFKQLQRINDGGHNDGGLFLVSWQLDFSAFKTLQDVNKQLGIQYYVGTAITGFNNLGHAGAIDIRECAFLETLDAFNTATDLGEIQLWDNGVLSPLDSVFRILGFSALTHANVLRVRNHARSLYAPLPNLVTANTLQVLHGTATFIDAFHSLTFAKDHLEFTELPQVTYIRGVDTLTRWTGQLSLKTLPLLETLTDFAPHAVTGGTLTLQGLGVHNLTNCFTELETVNEFWFGDGLDSLTELHSSLSNLRNTTGIFLVQSLHLPHTRYFDKLSYVGGEFKFQDWCGAAQQEGTDSVAPSVTVLDGFNALTSIGNKMTLSGRWVRNVTGFNALTSVPEILVERPLWDYGGSGPTPEDAVYRITGFQSLTHVDKLTITLMNRPYVSPLFAALQTVGDLTLTDLQRQEVLGFDHLQAVTGSLTVKSSPQIKHWGLSRLHGSSLTTDIEVPALCCGTLSAFLARVGSSQDPTGQCSAAPECASCWPWSGPSLSEAAPCALAPSAQCSEDGLWTVPPLDCGCTTGPQHEPCGPEGSSSSTALEFVSSSSSSSSSLSSSSFSSSSSSSSFSSTGEAAVTDSSSSSTASSAIPSASSSTSSSSSSTASAQAVQVPEVVPPLEGSSLRFTLELKAVNGQLPPITQQFIQALALAMSVSVDRIRVAGTTGSSVLIDVLADEAAGAPTPQQAFAALQTSLDSPPPALTDSLAVNARAVLVPAAPVPGYYPPVSEQPVALWIGLAVGLGVMLIIAACIVYALCRKRRKHRTHTILYKAATSGKPAKTVEETGAPPQIIVNNYVHITVNNHDETDTATAAGHSHTETSQEADAEAAVAIETPLTAA